MDIKLELDAKKVQKALGATAKQMEKLHRRAAKSYRSQCSGNQQQRESGD